jgi:predicted membrane protein
MNLIPVSNALYDSEQSGKHSPAARGGTTLGFFHSSRVTNHGRSLNGHSVSSVFGTIKIDLTAEDLPEGETTIHAYSIFGTIDVLVASDVGIRITGTSLFSAIKVRGETVGDGLFSVSEYVSPGYNQAARRLRIDGASVFSSVKIKR